MSKFSKGKKRKDPAISTAALPDIVFMLLFFFMVTTVFKEKESKKLEIIDKQLLELEVQRFSLEMSEPSRLQGEPQQYTQWQAAMLQFDTGIDKLRKAKFKTENG